jgi:hypothetical protein
VVHMLEVAGENRSVEDNGLVCRLGHHSYRPAKLDQEAADNGSSDKG